jgi:hypothetical protein
MWLIHGSKEFMMSKSFIVFLIFINLTLTRRGRKN